jgi:chromate transporter
LSRGVRRWCHGGRRGAIAGAVVVLGRKSLVDVPTLLIAAASLAAIIFVKKLPEPVLILAAGAAGLALRGLR